MFKKYITTIEGMKIYIVDGSVIRKKYIEFTSYGQPLRFKFVPDKEIWIDRENHPNEMIFLVIDALTEYKAMKKGKTYKQATDIVEKIDHSERRKKHQNLKFRKKFLGIKKSIKVYLVEGDFIRTNATPFFTEGGHDLVYEFIPFKQIWLDDDVIPKERKYILYHEYVERWLMENKNYSYNKAHKTASKLEKKKRNK